MRQVLSTAIVAVIVSLLTLTVAGAMAQSMPAEEAITPSAIRAKNADKVDGKHAVNFTNQRGRRAGKLVATNKGGWLPSNIVQPLWHLIKNKPGGFADGVDNEGVTSVRVMTVTAPADLVVASGTRGDQTVDCPTGFLAVGGGHDYISFSGTADYTIMESAALDADTWRIVVLGPSSGSATLKAQVSCLRAEPGGLATAVRRSVYSSGK